MLSLWALPHAVPPRTFVQRIKNNLRLARLQLKQPVFPACGPSSKSPSSQHGTQVRIFHQTHDAAPYPGPLYQVGGSLHALSQIPTWPPRGPTLASQFRLKVENSERGTSQKDGWSCNRMSMRTVLSDVRRRPIYLSVRVFPKPCPRGGAPCIACETNFNLRGYS